MKKILACVLWFVVHGAHAEWIYFHSTYGNSGEYYNPAIENKGKISVIRTFSQLPLPDMVPIEDLQQPTKFRLELYLSEQSTFEINCKDKTIHLTSRTFYHDVGGKFPLVTHGTKDKFIAGASSEFAKQFRRSPVYPQNIKALKMMSLACKGAA